MQFVCAGVDATDSYGLTRVYGYRDLTANAYKLTTSWVGGRTGYAPDSPQPLLRISTRPKPGGPPCRCDGPGVTALLKPFDLGWHPRTDVASTKGGP